jgi:hypothetical protein
LVLYVDRNPSVLRKLLAITYLNVHARRRVCRTLETLLLARLRRLIPILVLAALPALGAAACGSGDGDGNGSSNGTGGNDESPQKVINETFNGNKKVDSGKLNLALSAKLKGSGATAQSPNEPVTIKVRGPFQSRGETQLPELDLQLSAAGSGQDFSAGAISTGDQGFISYQGKDYSVPDNVFAQYKRNFAQQQKKDRSSDNLDIGALGIDPEKWLDNPKNEGDEDIEGVKTTHVSAGVNLPALLDDVNDLLKRTDQLGLTKTQRQQLPAQLSSSTKKQIQDAVKEAKVDVFTGKDDKTLRRLELSVSFDVPEQLKTQAQGVEGGDVGLTLELADLNQKQDISAPASARPWSELQQQLGLSALGNSLGNGSAGGAGSGSTGSSGSGAASGGGLSASDRKRTERYLKCVQKAKTPDDVQACGSALNK